MGSEMIKTNVYLTIDQHRELKLIYAKTGQRITETVRDAIDYYMKNNKSID